VGSEGARKAGRGSVRAGTCSQHGGEGGLARAASAAIATDTNRVRGLHCSAKHGIILAGVLLDMELKKNAFSCLASHATASIAPESSCTRASTAPWMYRRSGGAFQPATPEARRPSHRTGLCQGDMVSWKQFSPSTLPASLEASRPITVRPLDAVWTATKVRPQASRSSELMHTTH